MTSIAKFPEFSTVKLSQKAEITRFTSQFEPYSDFNFTSLFCWNTEALTEVSHLNGNLVIRMPDYLSGNLIYSILGDKHIDQSISELLQTAKELKLVPDIVIQNIQNKDKFLVKQDRDSFDYVFSLKELAGFGGGRYKKKRHKANQYVKSLDGQLVEVNILRDLNKDKVAELKDLCGAWVAETSREEGDFASEREAITRLFDNFAEMDQIIIEVLISGKAKGFSVNGVVGEGYALCLFEKALKDTGNHIYPFLIGETAKILQSLGCSYVSWMQDLGLEGLRKSKMSYHPERMLKKYTVTLAS